MLIASGMAFGAKLHISWIDPVQNTDGSALTDLAKVRVEWGNCVSPGVFGTLQSGIAVPAGVHNTWVYPTGLRVVCVRAFAINSKSVSSVASETISRQVDQVGKPITIGKPVILTNH